MRDKDGDLACLFDLGKRGLELEEALAKVHAVGAESGTDYGGLDLGRVDLLVDDSRVPNIAAVGKRPWQAAGLGAGLVVPGWEPLFDSVLCAPLGVCDILVGVA